MAQNKRSFESDLQPVGMVEGDDFDYFIEYKNNPEPVLSKDFKDDDSEDDNTKNDNTENDHIENSNTKNDNAENYNTKNHSNKKDKTEKGNAENDNTENDDTENDNTENDNTESDSSWIESDESSNSSRGQLVSQPRRRLPEYNLTGFETDSVGLGIPSSQMTLRSSQVPTGSRVTSGSYVPGRGGPRRGSGNSSTDLGVLTELNGTSQDDKFGHLYQNLSEYEAAVSRESCQREKYDFPYGNDEEQQSWIERIYRALRNIEGVADGPRVLKTFITTKYSEKDFQRACWRILSATRNAHEQGRQTPKYVSQKYVQYASLSERLEDVIDVLKASKAACRGVLASEFLSRLVDHPKYELQRKQSNRILNKLKTIQNKAGQQAIKKGAVNEKGLWVGQDSQAEQVKRNEDVTSMVAEKPSQKRCRKSVPEEGEFGEEGEGEENEKDRGEDPEDGPSSSKRKRRGE